jgi:hypothetical protein
MDMPAGELDDILRDKYTFIQRASSDGSWRRLWNTHKVLHELSRLHTELFQAFTLQMLKANFAVRWRRSTEVLCFIEHQVPLLLAILVLSAVYNVDKLDSMKSLLVVVR